MYQDSPSREKSLAFAKRIVKLYRYLSDAEYNSLRHDCDELRKLLSAITLTTRSTITPNS